MIELSDGLGHELTDFWLESHRAILDTAFEFVPSPDPDELWSSHRFLFSVYQETLPGSKTGRIWRRLTSIHQGEIFVDFYFHVSYTPS
jgi:hypothetical protein